MWTSHSPFLVFCLRGQALLLVVIPGLRSCPSAGWAGPTLSQQREACSESFHHFTAGKCRFCGNSDTTSVFVELNADPWQERRVKSHFNFVCLHSEGTGFFFGSRKTHTHTHTCTHVLFFLRKEISSEIDMLCFILSEVERQFSECSMAVPGLQGWSGLFLSIPPHITQGVPWDTTCHCRRSTFKTRSECRAGCPPNSGMSRVLSPPQCTAQDSQVLFYFTFIQIKGACEVT